MKYFTLIILAGLFITCSKNSIIIPQETPKNINLKYFGFTLVDVSFDDPTDNEDKTNYIDEVAGFSNIADIFIYEADQNIEENLDVFENYDVQAYLHISEVFFEFVNETDSLSKARYDLRPDYLERWNLFVATNNLHNRKDQLIAFYLGEEPTWNGISFEALETAANVLQGFSTEIAIMVIEAYPVIDRLELPLAVDWVGFDHYFIENPLTSEVFQSELNTLKSKMNANQELVIVMDSHYRSIFHRIEGIRKSEMDEVAARYYELANIEETTVALVGYHWPSGFEANAVVGARHMPDAAKAAYEQMGKNITNK